MKNASIASEPSTFSLLLSGRRVRKTFFNLILICLMVWFLTGSGHNGAPTARGQSRLTPNAPISFKSPVTYNVPAASDVVVAADLDGDHHPDVVACGAQQVGVLYGEKHGKLAPYQTILTWNSNISVRAVADLNGDGRPDIVCIDASGNVIILYNLGNRQFAAPYVINIGGNGSWVSVEDLNGDGRPDIVVSLPGNYSYGAVVILLNNGDGTFTLHTSFTHGWIVQGVATGDLNGDGKPDLVVTFETDIVGTSGVTLYYGDGKGDFTEGPTYTTDTGAVTSPIIADLNGDGKRDLVYCGYNDYSVTVFLNNGDGTFGAPHSYGCDGYPLVLRVADFNRDGRPDIVVANAGTSHITVFRNLGQGQFASGVAFPSGGGDCRSCYEADFNGDHRRDLVVQNSATNSVSVLINNTKIH